MITTDFKHGAEFMYTIKKILVENGTSTFELKFLVEDIELFFESI